MSSTSSCATSATSGTPTGAASPPMSCAPCSPCSEPWVGTWELSYPRSSVPGMSELASRVVAQYLAINGDPPMPPADDAYVGRHFVTLAELCVGRDETPDQVREHMLAGRLPTPSYLRSDGVEMVPSDLL